MMNEVVIVGRDAPAWLAANVVSSALGPAGVRVSVVELPSALDPGDVHAALPALEALHARLRIDEAKLLAATRGTYSLGTHFADTTSQAPDFFHAYGSTGARIDNLEFLPHWLSARAQGLSVAFEDFCLTAAAAKHGRMLLPDAEIERQGFTDYGYHLPAIPYAAWLKRLALQRGVSSHEAKEFAVLAREDGGIDALLLSDGRRIGGDFFLDASGEESLLLGRELGIPRERWRDAFPADRVLTAHAAPIASLPIYADARAGETGWLALHPSRACTHVVYAYSSGIADDIALANATKLARMDLNGARIQPRDPGRRVLAWQANCVAIGAAACVFDPLFGVELQAVQLGLAHLLPLFPVSGDYAVERDEYNHNVRSAFERLRDFQSAHHALNRYGGAFWSRARLTPLSASLIHRIGVFRARGETIHYEDESFTIADWQSLFIGHGVIPETHDPAVDRTAPELLHGELRRILAFIRQKVEAQRTHADFLRAQHTSQIPS